MGLETYNNHSKIIFFFTIEHEVETHNSHAPKNTGAFFTMEHEVETHNSHAPKNTGAFFTMEHEVETYNNHTKILDFFPHGT